MERFGPVGNFLWLKNVVSLIFCCLLKGVAFLLKTYPSHKNLVHFIATTMSNMNNQNSLKEYYIFKHLWTIDQQHVQCRLACSVMGCVEQIYRSLIVTSQNKRDDIAHASNLRSISKNRKVQICLCLVQYTIFNNLVSLTPRQLLLIGTLA